MLLLSCELELVININCKMNKLIIDAAKDKIFLMVINNDTKYSIKHENTKINYEKLTLLINDFLYKKKNNKRKN